MATRWACLGPGNISSDFFQAIRENLPAADHEFISVASRDLGKAQKFADKFKFKRALETYDDIAKDEEVEVVYIGTLHTTHAELSIKMLEAGKHVVCEKPMAMNWKQAKTVLDMAKKNNKFFMEVMKMIMNNNMVPDQTACICRLIWNHVGFKSINPSPNNKILEHEKPMTMNWKQAKTVLNTAKKNNKFFMEALWSRFFPVYHQIRTEKAEGTLGDIKLVTADFCIPIAHVERIKNLNLGGGGLLDIGIYPVQFACFVYDNEWPVEIKAIGNLTNTGVDESAIIVLKYKNGAMANLTYHIDAGTGKNMACIQGQKGRVDVETPFWCPTKVTTPSGKYEFPLTGDYNYGNSGGLNYEAAAARESIMKGELENQFASHKDTEVIHRIMDEVRRQLGMKYPEDD